MYTFLGHRPPPLFGLISLSKTGIPQRYLVLNVTVDKEGRKYKPLTGTDYLSGREGLTRGSTT